jgi:hypothetical protein
LLKRVALKRYRIKHFSDYGQQAQLFSNQNSKNFSNLIEQRIIPSDIKKPGRKSEAKFESVGFDSFQTINLQTYELNDDKLAETILVRIVDEIRSRASSSSKGSVDSLYQYQNSPDHLNSQLEINASKFSIRDKNEVFDKISEKTKIVYDQPKQEENNLVSITSFNNQRKKFLSNQAIRQPIKNEKMFPFNINNELIESKKEGNKQIIEPTLNKITSKRETKLKQNELNQSKGPILNIIQPNSNKLAKNDINKEQKKSTSEYLPISENIQIKPTVNKQVFPIVTPQNEKNVIQNLSVPENKKNLIINRQDKERKQATNYHEPKKVKEKPSKEPHRNRNMMQKKSVTANKPKIFNKKPEDIDNDPLPTYENYIKMNKIDFETNDSFIEILSGTSIQDTGSNKSDENYLEDNNENKQTNRGLKITFPIIEEEINQQISSKNKFDSIIENENQKQNYTRNTSGNISMDDDIRNMVAFESVKNKDLNMEQIIKTNVNNKDTNDEDSLDVNKIEKVNKYEIYEFKKNRNNISKVENTEIIENSKEINNFDMGNVDEDIEIKDSPNILNESESLKKTEFKTKFETTKLRDNKNEHKEAEMKKNNSSESENSKEFKAIEIKENIDRKDSITIDLNKAGTNETSAAKNFESIEIKDNKNEHKEANLKKINSFESKDVKEFKTNEIKENKDKDRNESIKIELNKGKNDEKSEVKDLEVIELKYNKNEQKKVDKKKTQSFESENDKEFKNIEVNEVKNKDRNEIIKIDLNIERDLNKAENDEKSEVIEIIEIKDNEKEHKEVGMKKLHSFENENDKEFKTIRIKENIDSMTNETSKAKVETMNEIKVIDDQYNNKIYNRVEDIEIKNNKELEFIEIKANKPNNIDIQNDSEMKIRTKLNDEAKTIKIKDKKVKDFKDAKNFQNLENNLDKVNKAEIIDDKNDENIEIDDDNKKILKEIKTIKITSNLNEKNKFKTNDNYVKKNEINEIESEIKTNELDTDFETEEVQSKSLNISKTETEISENDHDDFCTENITENNNVTIENKTILIATDDIQETESHNNKQKQDKTFRNIFSGKFITNNVFVTKLNRNSSDPYLFSLADDENLNKFDESLISKIKI